MLGENKVDWMCLCNYLLFDWLKVEFSNKSSKSNVDTDNEKFVLEKLEKNNEEEESNTTKGLALIFPNTNKFQVRFLNFWLWNRFS